MKTIRFAIQDIAGLEEKVLYDEFRYFNPFTDRHRDLIIHVRNDWIEMPSLGWSGSFFDFKCKFRLGLPVPTNPDSETQAKLKVISGQLKKAEHTRRQLVENLYGKYTCGTMPAVQLHLEAWVDHRHPHFLPDSPDFNCILRHNLFRKPEPLNKRKYFALEYLQALFAQRLTKNDILAISEIKVVFTPIYTISMK